MISKYMTKDKLKSFVSGIFNSKMSYCLPVFGNVFGLDDYKESNSRYTSFTIKDNNSLQVLQNKVNRLLLDAEYTTPTVELLKATGSLSIQQMIAYQTVVSAQKIIQSKKPLYLANKMRSKEDCMRLRGRQCSVGQSNHTLSIARKGFVYRSTSLINKLDEELRSESNINKFKKGVKEWVKKNIAVKPTPKYPDLSSGNRQHHPNPPPEPPDPPENSNIIRRYLIPSGKSQSIPSPTLSTPIHGSYSIKRYFPPIQKRDSPATWPCFPALPSPAGT